MGWYGTLAARLLFSLDVVAYARDRGTTPLCLVGLILKIGLFGYTCYGIPWSLCVSDVDLSLASTDTDVEVEDLSRLVEIFQKAAKE